MPFVPPRPVSDVTLVQHVKDKNDPHDTLKRAKQVRMFSSYPSGSDLDMLNDGDLVIVYSTGAQYRASVKDADGSRVVSLVKLPMSEVTKDEVDAKADKATTLEGYGITDAATKEELSVKADLVGGKVPAAQLPSFVDDVLEYGSKSEFPASGENSKIYVAKDTNLVYRWSGTQYVEISPSPVLDDTVTKTSSNGVKSSGVWSWVKSLLPQWLTSDYAEPATAASVAKKADKTALDNHVKNTNNPHAVTADLVGALRYENRHGTFHAIYTNENDGGDWGFYKQGAVFLLPHGEGAASGGVLALRSDLSALDLKADEFTRFTWTSENPGLPAGWLDLANSPSAPQPDFAGGYWSCGIIGGYYVVDPARGTEDDLTFVLGFADDATETVFKATATRKRVLRTGDAATPQELAQIASEVQSKRPLTDNACHQSQLGNVWTCDPPLPEGYEIARYSEGPAGWQPKLNGISMGEGKLDPGNTATTLSWDAIEWQGGYAFTATRTTVAKSGEPFVTEGSISTNNPAFVSAVQNTPTSGMPDDMPTDWGTYGTVGAALAALAAGLKWCKNILGSLASGYSTFAAWIASKLDRASLLAEYSATSAYSVGAIVYHDGNIYQCKTAIADGGEAWNAEHWELRRLDGFFTESNSLLTGTIDDRLPIPISAKSAGFTTESYKRFIVTVSGDMTVTLHTPTSGDAEIFECRFNGASLSADASITFAGATATTMDTDCGTVKAGKVSLMSAFWNGTTWDVNWKVEG